MLLPFTRKIDVTVPAMEYSLADPDYAVAHTVTVKGHDTRNLLGRGKFVGTFDVSGIDNGEFHAAHVKFPMPADCFNCFFSEPHGYTATQEVFSLTADPDWTSFSALLMDVTEIGGRRSGYFDAAIGRFLVSGTPSRTEALATIKAVDSWAIHFDD